MQDIIRKLTSRKLWVSIASFVSMLLVALGHTESEAAQVTALIIAGATVLGYVIGEGLVDAAREGSSTASDASNTTPAADTTDTVPAA